MKSIPDNALQTALSELKGVEGWLTLHESIILYVLAHMLTSDGEIVEIGSWKGKSTIMLANGLNTSRKSGYVWAVDPHEGSIKAGKKEQGSTLEEFEKNIRSSRAKDRVKAIVGTSADAARRWKKPIRLLFIDGLHDYQHVSADIAYWSSWVVNGGCIAFHDAFCGEPGVWKAVSLHIFNRKDIVNIGTVSSILFVILGKPTFTQKIIVGLKKILIYTATLLHSFKLPWTFKLLVIHRFIRICLWNTYTAKVYTYKATL